MADGLAPTNVRIRRKVAREKNRAREAEATARYLDQEKRAYADTYQATTQSDPRYQTIDTKNRAARAEYNSVAQNRELRKQQKQSEAYQNARGAQLAANRTAGRNTIAALRKRKLFQYKSKGFSAGKARRRLRVIPTSISILWYGLGAWFSVGLLMWVVSMFGLGGAFMGEDWLGWLSIFGTDAAAPGKYLFGFGYFIVIVVGWLTLGGAMMFYSIRQVNWLQSLPLAMLIFCFALYAGPVVNVVPWFVFFVLAVLWSNR